MYGKLFTKILDSSIWLEPTSIRIVWVTFIAMMDQDGFVALSGIGNVAARARVTEEEAEQAIKCLESPDTRNPGQEHDGRRIERIPGMGWMVLNSEKYRNMVKAETVRAQTRERVKKHRGNAPVTQCNENVTPSDEYETKNEHESENVKAAQNESEPASPSDSSCAPIRSTDSDSQGSLPKKPSREVGRVRLWAVLEPVMARAGKQANSDRTSLRQLFDDTIWHTSLSDEQGWEQTQRAIEIAKLAKSNGHKPMAYFTSQIGKCKA